MPALSRDSRPQENKAEDNEKRLKDKVHFCIRNVMKSEDPMDPDDVDAQHEAHASEHAPEKCGRRRSLALHYKPYQKSHRDCDYRYLTSRGSDRN